MTYIIPCAILIFFSMIGFSCIVRWLVFKLCRAKDDSTIMLITPVGQCCDEAEFNLRSSAAKTRWLGRSRPQKVICLNKGMDKDTKRLCSLVCKEYEFMQMMELDELISYLQKL